MSKGETEMENFNFQFLSFSVHGWMCMWKQRVWLLISHTHRAGKSWIHDYNSCYCWWLNNSRSIQISSTRFLAVWYVGNSSQHPIVRRCTGWCSGINNTNLLTGMFKYCFFAMFSCEVKSVAPHKNKSYFTNYPWNFMSKNILIKNFWLSINNTVNN